MPKNCMSINLIFFYIFTLQWVFSELHSMLLACCLCCHLASLLLMHSLSCMWTPTYGLRLFQNEKTGPRRIGNILEKITNDYSRSMVRMKYEKKRVTFQFIFNFFGKCTFPTEHLKTVVQRPDTTQCDWNRVQLCCWKIVFHAERPNPTESAPFWTSTGRLTVVQRRNTKSLDCLFVGYSCIQALRICLMHFTILLITRR
jgi:hypothetical protein